MKLFGASAAMVVLVGLMLSARLAGALPAPKISMQQFTALYAVADPRVRLS